MQDRTRAVRTASRRLMAEITSTSRHLSGMVRVFRHAGSGRGAIATAVDLSCRAPCVADVVGARVAEVASFFAEPRTFRLYLLRVAAGAAAALFPAPFGRGTLVRARSCECSDQACRTGDRCRACRSLVVARTVCTEFRDPEGRRRAVFRVCSRCTRLSANFCGLELVVRRECARAVLTTVTNAGGPRRAAATSRVCSRKCAWCAHALSKPMLSIGL